MGAFGLTHGYLTPIISHMQVPRQECIHTHTLHTSAKLCDPNELKVIQTLVSDDQYLF